MSRARMIEFVRIAVFSAALSAFGIGVRAGTLSNIQFTDYSPLSGNAELTRRMLTPLTAAKLLKLLANTPASLRGQPVDLAKENFTLYVPAQMPPRGYGLLVFIPPWRDAKLPDGWTSALDEYGVIFVSADRSGNDASPFARREPLAVLAEQNIVKRYTIDLDRVFIGGFSGGSRVAMRVALGYPDIFRGALLNSGSDPIGNATAALPPKDLFLLFQGSSHLVYVTGEQDSFVRQADIASMHSMRDWCVFAVDNYVVRSMDHDVADAASFSKALNQLLSPLSADSGRLAACRSAYESELKTKLDQVGSLIVNGKRDDARALLNEIDARFGGLAAPRSLELANELEEK